MVEIVVFGFKAIRFLKYLDERSENYDACMQLCKNLEEHVGAKNGKVDMKALKEGIQKGRKDLAGIKENNERAECFHWLSFLCFVLSMSEALNKEEERGEDTQIISLAFVRSSSRKDCKLRKDMNRIVNGAKVKFDAEKEQKTLSQEIEDAILQEVKAAFAAKTLKNEAKAMIKKEAKAVGAEVKGAVKKEVKELWQEEETGDEAEEENAERTEGNEEKTDEKGTLKVDAEENQKKEAEKAKIETAVVAAAPIAGAALSTLRQVNEVKELVSSVQTAFLGSKDSKQCDLRKKLEKMLGTGEDPAEALLKEVRTEIRKTVRKEVSNKLKEFKQEVKDDILKKLKAEEDLPSEQLLGSAKAEGAEAEVVEAAAEEVGKEGAKEVAGEVVVGAQESVGLVSPVEELLGEATMEPDAMIFAGEVLAGLLL